MMKNQYFNLHKDNVRSSCIVKLLHYSVWISLVRWSHLQALSPSELCIHSIACCLQQIYDNLIAPMQIFFGFKHQALNVFTEWEKNHCAGVDAKRFYCSHCVLPFLTFVLVPRCIWSVKWPFLPCSQHFVHRSYSTIFFVLFFSHVLSTAADDNRTELTAWKSVF